MCASFFTPKPATPIDDTEKIRKYIQELSYEKIAKQLNMPIKGSSMSNSNSASGSSGSTPGPGIGVGHSSNVSVGITSGSQAIQAAMAGISSSMGATYASSHRSPSISNGPACIILYGTNNDEILRLNNDGKVVWKDEKINEDAAAKAFSMALRLGADISVGLTEAVKREMRDVVFNEIIEIAKEDGPLSANQLQYLHRSAKIIDKLKGKI